ncbi:hypothetical protein [Paractinoplanes lichenicola]|uniref:Uncharacterized protein n=1 Tax=Paractinoplanes lichenicola TaxID=2802976 RepID=A0ABS1VY64_9ACTN|nr:hypothetical protein [Actinoplanes lichenicola]MBL7259433.1 hypothetical protein [Actinoplanes lichenicola]
MAGPVTSIAEVPLEELRLPGELRGPAERLESYQVQWHWYPEHAEPPASPPDRVCMLVFDGTISLFSTGVDWLELALHVAWEPELAVHASVEVACWCPQNHNMHAIAEATWLTGTPAALLSSFTAGVDMLIGFIDAGVSDVTLLRSEAGLPNP